MTLKYKMGVEKYEDIAIAEQGDSFMGRRNGTHFSANFSLFLIAQARTMGCDFEDLADGYGVGMGTLQPNGESDWSGIRDSSSEAVERMLERTLNYLFTD